MLYSYSGINDTPISLLRKLIVYHANFFCITEIWTLANLSATLDVFNFSYYNVYNGNVFNIFICSLNLTSFSFFSF